MSVRLLAAHVVADTEPAADGEIIRELVLMPDGAFVEGLQLLHGEVLRIHIEEDGKRGWEWIRIDPEHGVVDRILPVDDDGDPA